MRHAGYYLKAGGDPEVLLNHPPEIVNQLLLFRSSFFGGTGSSTGIMCRRKGEAERPSHFGLDSATDIGIGPYEVFGILAALTEPFALEAKPRSALFNDLILYRQIQKIALPGYSFAVHNIEFRFLERRSDFVLNDLHLRAIANNRITVLYGAGAANLEPDR